VSLLIVIPCLNEQAHLPWLLDFLCADPAAENARIVVVDGGSVDASQRIVRERAERDPRITLLANPKRIQSAGVNMAVHAFGMNSDVFIRVDAHARYPTKFLTGLLEAQAETGADSVAVSMRAAHEPGACFQAAAASAQNSVLGAGGSPHRKPGPRRWVDHGHHALFRTAAFLAAGGYDETFTHNEDAEFDARLLAAGGKILLAGDVLIDYFPRTRPADLARQYFQHGRGRALTMMKHRAAPKLRQLAAASIGPVLLLGVFAGPVTPIAAAPAAIWLTACLIYGAALGLKQRSVCASAAGFAAVIMHAAWSFGFLFGLATGARTRRPLSERAA
jgi:succinoglycan biosynthesis protein ExoA